MRSRGLTGFGAQRVWKGFRTGDQRMLLLGIGALLVAWLQRTRPRTLLYSENLSPGESITVTAERNESRLD